MLDKKAEAAPDVTRPLAAGAEAGVDAGGGFDDDIPFAPPVALDGLPWA